MKLLPSHLAVYRLPPELPVEPAADLPGVFLKAFESEDLRRFFAGDGFRVRTFSQFLEWGFQGVLAHDGQGWAGYGWVSSRQTPGPPHLSHGIAKAHPHWLFYAHTREAFRGRGLQKAMVRRRLQYLGAAGGRADWVYSDAISSNIPSRRALLAVGFQPAGTMLRLEIPRPLLEPWQLCWWDPLLPHPPLPGVAHEVGP